MLFSYLFHSIYNYKNWRFWLLNMFLNTVEKIFGETDYHVALGWDQLFRRLVQSRLVAVELPILGRWAACFCMYLHYHFTFYCLLYFTLCVVFWLVSLIYLMLCNNAYVFWFWNYCSVVTDSLAKLLIPHVVLFEHYHDFSPFKSERYFSSLSHS